MARLDAQGAVLEVEYLASVDRSEGLALVNEMVDIYCQVNWSQPAFLNRS